MAPQLDKIKVWEYYKYENGAYHNYALVINSQDTDVTLTIVKHHGWYYKPWPPNTMVSDGPYGIATTDSTMWNKLVHEPGDTFKNGIKLKAHEKKIIPDFFESIRSLNPLNKLGPTQLIHIAVLANGQYAGDYTIKKIRMPDSLPKSGIIYCLRINSGEPLPIFLCLKENKYKPNKSCDLTIYHYNRSNRDTIEINAIDTGSRLDKFFGLTIIQPSAIIVNPPRESYVISEERKTKNVMHMKLVNVNDETNVTIKTPDTKKIVFTGIDFFCFNSFWKRNQRVEVLIPMNIKL